MAATVSSVLQFVARFFSGNASESATTLLVPEYHRTCSTDSCCRALSVEDDKSIGFHRSEMGSKTLSGSVSPYTRHIFCAGGSAKAWPSKTYECSPSAQTLVAAALTGKVRASAGFDMEEGGEGGKGDIGQIKEISISKVIIEHTHFHQSTAPLY